MAVPCIGKIAETRHVGVSVEPAQIQTYGMKSMQLVTERAIWTELFEDKQVFCT